MPQLVSDPVLLDDLHLKKYIFAPYPGEFIEFCQNPSSNLPELKQLLAQRRFEGIDYVPGP